jgi:hypothetical protein
MWTHPLDCLIHPRRPIDARGLVQCLDFFIADCILDLPIEQQLLPPSLHIPNDGGVALEKMRRIRNSRTVFTLTTAIEIRKPVPLNDPTALGYFHHTSRQVPFPAPL